MAVNYYRFATWYEEEQFTYLQIQNIQRFTLE